MFSRMPLPASWDSDSMFEPASLGTDTTVSDDVWKKFELDCPLDQYAHRYQNELHNDMTQATSLPAYYEVPPMLHFDKLNCQASREIRHHDCMWAGLCISKEHNRTHPAKKDNLVQRRIPAGRSLLIPKNQNLQQQSQPQHCGNLQSHSLTSSNVHNHNNMASSNGYHQNNCRTMTKNLESDGDSTRPETPQSNESETESEEDEDEAPIFRHEQINIDDIVSMPVSSPGEVTNQSLRPLANRRKAEQMLAQEQSTKENIRNTLMSDHCYHLNQQQPASSKKLDNLGVQTPSDSEEEIDVVSYDKPTRATTTTTYPNLAERHQYQHNVNTGFKPEKNGNGNSNVNSTCSTPAVVIAPTPTPRPRGRPPTNPASRKRQLENAAAATTTTTKAPAAKKPRNNRGNQKKRNSPKKQAKSSPIASPAKTNSSNASSSSSSEDEPDIEKRSLHNNMERQRRIELRNAFEELRRMVPAIADKEKAAKVTILRQSAAFCYKLFDMDRINEANVYELKMKQDRLRAQLSQLRRDLALQR
ncbi:hypothetical protein TSAR_002162 [Trichomalopsis sarcophagae]|uniref:BHLH domain-containing protein n=1 Tax=Trichomalopsis sarcophagae TaxID=543379 RepID=A0A232EY90_9HYME|nr:hypothetical protein TSAR_002162 [Trichomalopsis sarcophagae]